MKLNAFKRGAPLLRLPHKFLLVMKITSFILLIAIMSASATTLAQKITLSEKNITLENALNKIRIQSGYDFVYSAKLIKNGKPVTITLKDATLEDALTACFENQQLTFNITEKTVLVKAKEPGFFDKVVIAFNTIDVRGRVVDEKGQPLPGVTIKLKDGSQITTTDNNGLFFLKKVNEKAVVVISFIGFLSRELSAAENLGTIALEIGNSRLDEVQVIAYGTTSQRLSTGDISSISAKDIEKQPVNNPLLALAGRVPGLQITQKNGLSGGGVSVLIQGQNSLTWGNDPFYVIDGVPFSSQLLPNMADILGNSRSAGLSEGNNGNPLSFINPLDIESIAILKDADATAIYGSRAANGAILITTKKGRNGEFKVDINLQSGIGRVPKKVNLLQTPQYLEMRKEAYQNGGVTTYPPSAYDINGVWDQRRYTDWQKELIGNSAQYNDGQFSISGGNNDITYLIGTGFHRETTVFPGQSADQKESIHFSLNRTLPAHKFKFSLSGNYLLDNNRLFGTDLTARAMTLAPDAPAGYNPDGTINWAPKSDGTSTFDTNPYALLNNVYKNNTSNLIINGTVAYELFKDFDIKTTFGYTNLQTDEFSASPFSAIRPETRPDNLRGAAYGNNNINSWIAEPQITYNKVFGKGHLNFLMGTTFQQTNSDRKLLYGAGYNSDEVLENINAATTISAPPNTAIQSTYKYAAMFSRINYNYDDRYILNLSVRRDGSSRFGSRNQFHVFAAVGTAWIFSNEGFIKEEFPVLSFGKLRFSYGTTGSDQIGDYRFLSLYDNNNPAVPYRNGTVLKPSELANPFLQWEETRKLSLGLDLGFLNDRVLLNATYFRNRSSNQLLSIGLPETTGFGRVLTNLPATVQNEGLELSLTTENIRNDRLRWSTGFNVTVPRNKMLRFDNFESSGYASDYIIGKPVSFIRLYKSAGVDAATGRYNFVDHEGNLTTDPGDGLENKTEVLFTAPTLYGGLQNSISYDKFQLDFLFQFVKQKGQNNLYGTGTAGFGKVNQPTSVLNRWQKPGDNALIQQYSATNFDQIFGGLRVLASDAAWGDASYIRLKNVSFSWQLPDRIKDRLHLKNARLYLQGQNLLTITGYKGLDPETTSSTVLPPLRVISLGLQITL